MAKQELSAEDLQKLRNMLYVLDEVLDSNKPLSNSQLEEWLATLKEIVEK